MSTYDAYVTTVDERFRRGRLLYLVIELDDGTTERIMENDIVILSVSADY